MMQVYLPYPKLKLVNMTLATSDLTHQRNVIAAIAESLLGNAKGWTWHPGVTMWLGSFELLGHIGYLANDEWAKRLAEDDKCGPGGAKQLKLDYEAQLKALNLLRLSKPPDPMPWWWGYKRFHEGNKSALIRHDPLWYGSLYTDVANDLCDWWPRQTPDTWVYGPQRGPNGDYAEYFLNEKPILESVRRMNAHDFAAHANRYHNLTPGDELTVKTPTLDILRAMHDRFHQKKVYSTHDHRG
jgi:hypothetical protein